MLSAAKTTVGFLSFISEDHVIEGLSNMLTCPCQSLYFVSVSDQLTVATSTKCPSQGGSAA